MFVETIDNALKHIDFFVKRRNRTIKFELNDFRGSKQETLQLDKGFAYSPRISKYKRFKKLGDVSSKVKHVLEEGDEFKTYNRNDLSRRTGDNTDSTGLGFTRDDEDSFREFEDSHECLLGSQPSCPCPSPLLDPSAVESQRNQSTSDCPSCVALALNVSLFLF